MTVTQEPCPQAPLGHQVGAAVRTPFLASTRVAAATFRQAVETPLRLQQARLGAQH